MKYRLFQILLFLAIINTMFISSMNAADDIDLNGLTPSEKIVFRKATFQYKKNVVENDNLWRDVTMSLGRAAYGCGVLSATIGIPVIIYTNFSESKFDDILGYGAAAWIGSAAAAYFGSSKYAQLVRSKFQRYLGIYSAQYEQDHAHVYY